MNPNVTQSDDPSTFPNTYAATLVGECLEPLLHDGSIFVCDQSAPIRGGDLVEIFLAGAGTQPSRIVRRLAAGLMPGVTFPFSVPEGGDDSEMASNVAPRIILESLNPPRALEVRPEHVRAIHRIVGEAEMTESGGCRLVARFGDDGERIPVAVAA